jgi:hypothetical protein
MNVKRCWIKRLFQLGEGALHILKAHYEAKETIGKHYIDVSESQSVWKRHRVAHQFRLEAAIFIVTTIEVKILNV